MNLKIKILKCIRWLLVLTAVISLVTMFKSDPISDADPETVAAKVVETIDMEHMLKADNQMFKRFYGLDPSVFEACILYYPSTNMMAEELLIVKLSDVSQQEPVRAAIEARIKTQKTTFEGYGVEQYDMLTNNAVVEIRGNYVLFVVNPASAQARKAFLDAL